MAEADDFDAVLSQASHNELKAASGAWERGTPGVERRVKFSDGAVNFTAETSI